MNAAAQHPSIGRRVELAPHLDAWMAGDRYGVVVKVGRKYHYVKMDRSGRTLCVLPSALTLLAR